MTKKVNSITFRLGYNLFWFYKRSNFFFFFKFRNVFKVCKNKLRLIKFIVVFFNYFFDSIYIYTYLVKRTKNLRKKFIKKKDSLKRFLIVKQYLLEKKNFSKKRSTKNFLRKAYFINLTAEKMLFWSNKNIDLYNNKKTNVFFMRYIKRYLYLQRLKTLLRLYSKFLFLNSSAFILYFYYFNIYYNFFRHDFKLKKKYSGFSIMIDYQFLIVTWLKFKSTYFKALRDDKLNCKFYVNHPNLMLKWIQLIRRIYGEYINKYKSLKKKPLCLRRFQVMYYYFLVFLSVEEEKKRFFLKRKNKIKINLLKLLLFKNKELMLETSIFFIYKYKLNIFLCNILNYININNFLNYFDTSWYVIRRPWLRVGNKLIPNIRNKLIRTKLIHKKRYNLMLYLFFFFKNTELIAKFFAYNLLKTKKHIKNVKISLRLFYSLFIKVRQVIIKI